jgi:Mce-associated membrane protein
MTPRPGTAGGETNEPGKEPDAVSVDTESATGQDAATVGEEAADKAEKGAATNEHAEDVSDGDANTESTDTPSEEPEHDEDGEDGGPAKSKRSISFSRLFAFGLLPCLLLLLAAAGGYLKWQSSSIRASQTSSVESVAAAKDATVAMLSYQPDTVEKDLGAARDRLTGTFKDSYTQLTHDVVMPGAKQRHISAVATVPAAASVSATANHAVALVFVNQTAVVGTEPPSATASTVRVTLDKVGDRWLISGFDPV